MITKAQRDYKVSTKTTPFPTKPTNRKWILDRLNRKLGYYDSCTLCKVSALYLRVVISSLAKRLGKLLFAILTLPLVYGPEITTCHYKDLIQEYVMLCYGFSIKGPACSAKDPQQRPLLHCVVQAFHKVWHKECCQSPLNWARHTTYNISN
jgi:hypothetical protein